MRISNKNEHFAKYLNIQRLFQECSKQTSEKRIFRLKFISKKRKKYMSTVALCREMGTSPVPLQEPFGAAAAEGTPTLPKAKPIKF